MLKFYAHPGDWFTRQADRGNDRTEMTNHILADDGRTLCGLFLERVWGLRPHKADVRRNGKRVHDDCQRCAKALEALRAEEASARSTEPITVPQGPGPR